MHVNVFAYGTLRERGDGTDEWLSIHGWDSRAKLIGDPGEWVLHDYGLYTMPKSIPAVTWTRDAKVVGDVVQVTLHGFRNLLNYESFPSLYDYDVVEAVNRDGVTIEVVVFTVAHARQFGPLSSTGDWFDPRPIEEVRCESQIRVGG